MPVKGENYNKVAKLSNHSSLQTKNYWENLWLRAKIEANLKLELKMKFVQNTCDKELGGKMKFVNDNYFKSSLKNFQKSLAFREIYVKYLENNSIVIGILF